MRASVKWVFLVCFFNLLSSSSFAFDDTKSPSAAKKEENLELEFHRIAINKRPTFFNEEIVDEQLARADPFIDLFIDFDEYADSPKFFPHLPHKYRNVVVGRGNPQKAFTFVSGFTSNSRRFPRDVDSNAIIEDPRHSKTQQLGQLVNDSSSPLLHEDHEDVDSNSLTDPLEKVSNDSSSGYNNSGSDISANDSSADVDSDSSSAMDALLLTIEAAINDTSSRDEEDNDENDILLPSNTDSGENSLNATLELLSAELENAGIDMNSTDLDSDQSTTEAAATTTMDGDTPAGAADSTTKATVTPTHRGKSNGTKNRRSNPLSSTPPSSPPSPSGNNADTIKWIRKQIELLLQNEQLSSQDVELLKTLNETLSKPNMEKLFELTVAFMKINEKISHINDVEEEEETTTAQRRDEDEENPETMACKNLNKLKILPVDDQEMVRLKYATAMKCYMDQTVDPCHDFYRFACGGWTEYHPIPKDKSGYDTFEILREDLHANLIAMFEEPIDPEVDNNATAAAKLLYSSCMDTTTIEERRETPLLSLLDEFGGWPVLMGEDWMPDNFSWIEAVTKLRMLNNDILVSIWIGPDGKDSDDFILQFDQSDLLLPSSDYYKLGFHHPIMQTYYNMLVEVATILGAETTAAEKEMKELIEFETELALIMISPLLRRNFSEIYKKMPLAELQRQVPGFNFSQYLDPILPRTLQDTEDVVIYALPFYQKLIKLVENTDKRVLSNYILWRFIRHRINNLDQRFEIAQHSLYRMLYGREETPPRKKFCVSYVNGNLGNVVGSLFVKRHFDGQSKKDMEALTGEVQTVFRDLVLKSDWLSDATKKLADVKIQNIVHNIGYPEDIIDESQLHKEVEGIEYHKKTFFENVLSNLRARTVREMSQLDDSVNRTLWTTTPAVVNAYYSRNRNQIMFPAAILQPPFYHKHFPKALNYGGIGIVIGHEITHGFDDKGRQFDFQGNIKQWWDLASFQNFRERKQCIIDQYGQYKVEEVDIHLNGENTQGENIADNGGIKQAFYAYKNWLERHNLLEEEPLPGLEGLSSEQLFFLNFAQVWCGHTRPEALRSKLKTAVHAPGPYRVLGTVSNSEEFARAFRCSNGSRDEPDRKVLSLVALKEEPLCT